MSAIPICPVGTAPETSVGGFLTTLFSTGPELTDPPEHAWNVATPFVEDEVPTYGLAIATPLKPLRSIPNSDESVPDEQNSP